MRKALLVLFVGLLSMGQTCGPTLPIDNLGVEELIFTNTNVAGVTSGPTAATTFTISDTYTLTRIRTYHWNGGDGTTSAGTIGLIGPGGEVIASFGAEGIAGQNDTPNATWEANFSDVTIEPGTYTITDSDSATWSCNSDSGNAGIAWVYGRKHDDGTDDETDILAMVKSFARVSFSFEGKHSYGGTPSAPLLNDLIVITNNENTLWGIEDVTAPIVWDGNSFTATYSGSETEGDTTTALTLQISGTLADDGRSISNWEALVVAVEDTILGQVTIRERLTSSDQALPFNETSGDWGVSYKATGSAVSNYIEGAEDSHEFFNYFYSSTDYTSNDPPAKLEIFFQKTLWY